MKTAKMVMVGGLLSCLMSANALARDVGSQYAGQVRQTAFEYDYLNAPQAGASNSPSDQPAAPVQKPAETAVPAASACQSACESGCTGGCKERPCRLCMNGKLADPWTIPQPEGLKDRNITIGGWLEGGIYGNQFGVPNNGPVGLRNVGDGFTADQLWIFGERKTDTKGCGWDVGGRIDYLFGADGPDTQAFGDRTWDYGWNTSRDYGSAIPQIYAEVAYNDVKIKFGRFYTPIGYEVVQSTGNFFYSHSYSHTFGEPFTHTGALADYAYNEKVHVLGGWTNGWDEGWEGKDGGSTFLGGLALTLSEKTTLAWYASAGKLGNGTAFPGAASGDLFYNCLVLTCKLNEKWTYVFEHDLGSNYNVNQRTGVDNQWYEVNNYLLYKINDCWSFGGRLEWFQDPQGTRVVAGERGNYYCATSGFNFKPHSNITIRPELRYDWFDPFAGNVGQPFNNGTSNTQISGGFDVVFTY